MTPNQKPLVLVPIIRGVPLSEAMLAQEAQQLVRSVLETHAAQLAHGSHLTVTDLTGTMAERWLDEHYTGGRHDSCDTQGACIAAYDQAIAALRDGGALLIATFYTTP